MERACGVLVVDDDPAIRLLCRINLELEGIEVHEAATLDEARRRLADPGIGVVLLDVHVAGADGRELLHEVRRERSDVRVALLTGSERGDFDGDRPDAVVGKPFTLDELLETVKRLAASR